MTCGTEAAPAPVREEPEPAPRLSVVVVNWNGAGYLADCLTSVRGPDREVLVVDNGSRDRSRELVETSFPEVRWLGNGVNLGFARAANRGLAAAGGRYVLFLNPDARSSEEALDAAIALLEARPAAGLVGVAMRDDLGRLTPTVEPFFGFRTLLGGRWESRVSAPAGPHPVDVDWFHGAFVLGRRTDLRTLGGFDERFFLYAEDMDLCFRVHESGKSVVYLPEVSIVHRGNLAGETAFGERRAAAIFSSCLTFYALRQGKAARRTLGALAAIYFALRAVAHRLQGSPLAGRYRSLARVAAGVPFEWPEDARGAALEVALEPPAPVEPDGSRSGLPAVTVGVLARADEPALGATLGSLAAAARRLEERGHEVSISICVNGSEGESAARAARSFAEAATGSRTRLVFEPRADKARAWNLVQSGASTPLVVYCDADVEVAPEALVLLVEALEREPRVALASARQVPRLSGASSVARAAALPYRFDFGVVGGRLYAMRREAIARMPEGLLLEDGWLSSVLGRDRLRTVGDAEVRFTPPATLADYFRERLRTEAGKLQIHAMRRVEAGSSEPIARYPWVEMRRLPVAEWPLVGLNLAVRFTARAAAIFAARRGREVRWATIRTSKPAPAAAEDA